MAEKNLGKVAVTTGGTYASSKAYDKLTIVNHNGASWISKTAVPAGNAPSESSSYWQLLLGASVPRIAMTSTSASINPNTFYVWGEVASLDITLNEGASAEENRYMFQFRNPKSGATVLTLPDDILWSVDTELDDDGLPLFGKGEYTRIEIIEGLASVKKWALPYIIFEDAEVERVLMANGLGDGTGITKQEAKGVTSIGTWFKGNTTITSFDELRFFTGVTTTSFQAMMGCTALKSIDLRNVTSLESSVFNGCTSLENITGTEAVTQIGDSTFLGCENLAINIYLPNLTAIAGRNSFKNSGILGILSLGVVTTLKDYFALGCASLKYAIIPETVTTIEVQVFRNCTSLQAVILKSATPPALWASNAFENTNNCPIYVPDASVEAYKGATNWNNTSIVSRIKGISDLQTDNPTLYAEIAEYL